MESSDTGSTYPNLRSPTTLDIARFVRLTHYSSTGSAVAQIRQHEYAVRMFLDGVITAQNHGPARPFHEDPSRELIL